MGAITERIDEEGVLPQRSIREDRIKGMRLNITQKLMIGFLVVLLCGTLSGAISYVSLGQMEVQLQSLYTPKGKDWEEGISAIFKDVKHTKMLTFALIMLEAAIVTLAGLVLGLAFLGLATYLLEPFLVSRFGLRIDVGSSLLRETRLAFAILVAGLTASIVPAIRVYRMTLADGLSFRL